MKQYCVDGERMWFTDDFGEAIKRAHSQRPCVLLKRIDNDGRFRPEVPVVWWEMGRYEDIPPDVESGE